MDEIVRVLLEKELIEREDFIALMEGAKVPDAAGSAACAAGPPDGGECPRCAVFRKAAPTAKPAA